MTKKEFEKGINASRKVVGNQFGFKKSGYVSYKIVDGYIFYIDHLVNTSVALKVKPLYSDDLWWDIFQIPENKKAPLSLRCNGAFALYGVPLAEYETFVGDWKDYTEQDFDKIWIAVFDKVQADIEDFISKNPISDKYIPPKISNNGKVSLLYLIALMHNNQAEEVLEHIHQAQQQGYRSGMSALVNGESVDGYTYILKYIEAN